MLREDYRERGSASFEYTTEPVTHRLTSPGPGRCPPQRSPHYQSSYLRYRDVSPLWPKCLEAWINHLLQGSWLVRITFMEPINSLWCVDFPRGYPQQLAISYKFHQVLHTAPSRPGIQDFFYVVYLFSIYNNFVCIGRDNLKLVIR